MNATQGSCLGALSLHNIQSAFGLGCDHSSYVEFKIGKSPVFRQLIRNIFESKTASDQL